jgi:hypothetical protein
MRKILGYSMLLGFHVAGFIVTVYFAGWKSTLMVWGGGLVFLAYISIALRLTRD